VVAYRLIGYENRLLANEDFNDDTKDAGELGAGHSVTALYEVIPVGVDSPFEIRGVDSLRYQTPGATTSTSDSPELMFVKLRYKAPDGEESRLIEQPALDSPDESSIDLRFAAAVAGFGMILRESEYCGADWTLADVLALARGSTGEDAEGYRAEFVRLVEAANSLELLAQATY
jgi:Ca-activated chloride channel family protein